MVFLAAKKQSRIVASSSKKDVEARDEVSAENETVEIAAAGIRGINGPNGQRQAVLHASPQSGRTISPNSGGVRSSPCAHLLAPIKLPEIVERTPGVGGYSAAKVRNASSVGSQQLTSTIYQLAGLTLAGSLTEPSDPLGRCSRPATA